MIRAASICVATSSFSFNPSIVQIWTMAFAGQDAGVQVGAVLLEAAEKGGSRV
jgi:hypothetical protein